jgi:hypothetical protein
MSIKKLQVGAAHDRVSSPRIAAAVPCSLADLKRLAVDLA